MTQNVYFADEAVKRQVQQLAAQEQRSFSAMVQILLKEALDARTRPDPLGEALNSGTGVYKP